MRIGAHHPAKDMSIEVCHRQTCGETCEYNTDQRLKQGSTSSRWQRRQGQQWLRRCSRRRVRTGENATNWKYITPYITFELTPCKISKVNDEINHIDITCYIFNFKSNIKKSITCVWLDCWFLLCTKCQWRHTLRVRALGNSSSWMTGSKLDKCPGMLENGLCTSF